MEQKLINATEIQLRLTSHGRYVWSISSTFSTDQAEGAIKDIKTMDQKMKEEFPNYIQSGSGRSANIDDYDKTE